MIVFDLFRSIRKETEFSQLDESLSQHTITLYAIF